MKLLAPLASFAAMAALVGLSLGTITPTPARAAAEGYKIDKDHSYVLFRIKHLNLAWAYGRFNDFSGTLNFDEANPASCSVNMEVKTTSVDTGNAKRDDHLRAPDYLDVAQFPTISFKSTAVKKVSDTQFDVTGDLTLHGKTKPVTVRFEKTGAGKDPWNNVRIGFEGIVTVKRSDYGMKVDPNVLGDEVRLTLSFEGIKG